MSIRLQLDDEETDVDINLSIENKSEYLPPDTEGVEYEQIAKKNCKVCSGKTKNSYQDMEMLAMSATSEYGPIARQYLSTKGDFYYGVHYDSEINGFKVGTIPVTIVGDDIVIRFKEEEVRYKGTVGLWRLITQDMSYFQEDHYFDDEDWVIYMDILLGANALIEGENTHGDVSQLYHGGGDKCVPHFNNGNNGVSSPYYAGGNEGIAPYYHEAGGNKGVSPYNHQSRYKGVSQYSYKGGSPSYGNEYAGRSSIPFNRQCGKQGVPYYYKGAKEGISPHNNGCGNKGVAPYYYKGGYKRVTPYTYYGSGYNGASANNYEGGNTNKGITPYNYEGGCGKKGVTPYNLQSGYKGVAPRNYENGYNGASAYNYEGGNKGVTPHNYGSGYKGATPYNYGGDCGNKGVAAYNYDSGYKGYNYDSGYNGTSAYNYEGGCGNKGISSYNYEGGNRGVSTYNYECSNNGVAPYSYEGGNKGSTPYSYEGGNKGVSPYSYEGGNKGDSPYSYEGGNKGVSPYSYESGNKGVSPYSYEGGNKGDSPYSYESGNKGVSPYSYEGGNKGFTPPHWNDYEIIKPRECGNPGVSPYHEDSYKGVPPQNYYGYSNKGVSPYSYEGGNKGVTPAHYEGCNKGGSPSYYEGENRQISQFNNQDKNVEVSKFFFLTYLGLKLTGYLARLLLNAIWKVTVWKLGGIVDAVKPHLYGKIGGLGAKIYDVIANRIPGAPSSSTLRKFWEWFQCPTCIYLKEMDELIRLLIVLQKPDSTKHFCGFTQSCLLFWILEHLVAIVGKEGGLERLIDWTKINKKLIKTSNLVHQLKNNLPWGYHHAKSPICKPLNKKIRRNKECVKQVERYDRLIAASENMREDVKVGMEVIQEIFVDDPKFFEKLDDYVKDISSKDLNIAFQKGLQLLQKYFK